jgi:hypothetical protein
MRTITLEEHFGIPDFLAGPGKEFMGRIRDSGPRGAKIYEQLKDIGDKRIADMDAANIDMQVLSLNSPGVEQSDAAEQISAARESNDFLADAVKKHPMRFAAFAALPTAAPEQAAEELEHRVRQQASRAPSSTAIPAAAIWTTSSSGPSWSGPRRSTRRSICIQRHRRKRCSMRNTAASAHP